MLAQCTGTNNEQASQSKLDLAKSSAKSGDPTNDSVYMDSFKPLTKHPVVDFKINVYQSSKDGQRFEFAQIDFNSLANANLGNVEAYVKIDLNQTNQVNFDFKSMIRFNFFFFYFKKIDGFGGSFTDAAGENLMKLSENVRQSIIDDYFDKDNGLEYTLGS